MKIIGKLHDYYDGLLAYGQDDSLVFKRETKVFEGKKDPVIKDVEDLLGIDTFKRGYWKNFISFPSGNLKSGDGARFRAETIFVGFCGKIYMGFEIRPETPNWANRKIQESHTTKFVYSVYDTRKLEDNFSMFAAMGRTDNIPWLTNMINHHRAGVDKIDATDFFVKYAVPYFVVKTNPHSGGVTKVEFVPELKKYEFQKVKDPYTAYQEISMYVGGVLPRQTPDMATVSDKDRIAQYGFNELSFRHPFKIKKEKK